MCDENEMAADGAGDDGPAAVPDFSVLGFDAANADGAGDIAVAHAQVAGLQALSLSVCVGASYNPNTKMICFSVPIYGNLCVKSPIPIPVGGSLKACAQTCGKIIPTGLKVTVYLNGKAIFTKTVVGKC